ncbi:MAG: sulfite exporter TauE/SafE family protein, partial [Propionicimonas sp.]
MTALTGQLRASQVGWLLLVGCLSGFFSGLFGVGGGLIIVPGLVVVLGMEQRRAVGTSLLAIVPAIAVGVAAYAYGGSVDVVAGGLLAVGAVVGAQLGTRVLMRLRRRTAQWIFVGFVSVMIVQLMLV